MLSSHTNKRGPSATPGNSDAVLHIAKQRNTVAAALQDLHRLLERYAPLWYRSKHRETAEQGLRQAGKGQAKALTVLHELLQEYSPTWYTEEHYRQAELALKSARKRNSNQKLPSS